MPPHPVSLILNAVHLCVITTEEFTFDAALYHVKALPYIQRIYNVKIKYVCVYKEFTFDGRLFHVKALPMFESSVFSAFAFVVFIPKVFIKLCNKL